MILTFLDFFLIPYQFLQAVYSESPNYYSIRIYLKERDIDAPLVETYMTGNARWQSWRPRYKAVAHAPNFAILVPAPELSLSDAKNNPFRKMRDTLYRERQLCSGDVGFVTWRSSSDGVI